MDIIRVLHAAIFTPNGSHWGLPVLLSGPPGAGKTAQVEAFTASMAAFCAVLIASSRPPEDFAGIPIPNVEHTHLTRLPDAWVANANAAKRGVVFFDEFNWSPPAVMAACLRVINERYAGDTRLAPGIRMVAAQNPQSSGGGGDLIKPMANRFLHLNWQDPSPDALDAYLSNRVDALLVVHARGGGDVAVPAAPKKNGKPVTMDPMAAEEARVLDAWPTAWGRAAALVGAFLSRHRRELVRQEPDASDPRASAAWASPRTWEMFARSLATAQVHGLGLEEEAAMLNGCVGAGPTQEFIAWRSTADLPDVVALLDGKLVWKHKPERLDVTAAVLDASTASVLSTTDKATQRKRADVLWALIDHVATDGGFDVAARSFGKLTKAARENGADTANNIMVNKWFEQASSLRQNTVGL